MNNLTYVSVLIDGAENTMAEEPTPLIVPVAVPSRAEIHQLAEKLHTKGVPYEGTAWGWPISYTPQKKTDALACCGLSFWPANFSIGISGVWFYTIDWEYDDGQTPGSFYQDWHVVDSPSAEWQKDA